MNEILKAHEIRIGDTVRYNDNPHTVTSITSDDTHTVLRLQPVGHVVGRWVRTHNSMGLRVIGRKALRGAPVSVRQASREWVLVGERLG